MKATALVLLLLSIIFCFIPQAFAVTIISTFDVDTEDWTISSGGALAYGDFGGNPNGFLKLTDIAGDTYVAFVPPKFKGDLSGVNGGLLSYDFIVIEPTTPLTSVGSGFGRIQLHGGGSNATFDYAPNPPIPSTTDWMPYYAPMTADAWHTTEENWARVLSDVTTMHIILQAGSVVGLDNFKIEAATAPVPEPASLLLLGAGLLGLCGFKRRRK